MLTPTGPVDPNLADALREAGDRVATMTPVQRALMAARQAVSYVEGGLGVALPDDHEAKITVRALALLDRVGDAAADALIKGEAAVVKHGERDDLRRIAQNFSDELGRISAAIGTDEFMPEGAPVPLHVQVSRMKAALDRARSEVLDLRYVIAGIMLDENNRGMSVKDKWESALKAITDVIVDGSVVSQGYADRIRRDGIAAGRLDKENDDA